MVATSTRRKRTGCTLNGDIGDSFEERKRIKTKEDFQASLQSSK